MPVYANAQNIMVVIPTYNESNNLPAIAAELFAQPVEGLEVLIVDDASPDGTGQVADSLAARYANRVHVIHRPRRSGLGTAYVTGFKYALAHGAGFIAQMDADFSHSPAYIPQFLDRLQEYDVVVGSRYVEGGQLDEQWGLGRYFLSWFANAVYARLILGLQVRDATAGFKCFRRKVLETIDLDKVRSNGYVFQVEMAYLCQKLGFKVLEIPILFEDRRIGKSKMAASAKMEAAWQVLEIRWRYRRL